MATHRPFRFGVQAATAADRKTWVDLARRVEDVGFSVLAMPDHFDEQLAPMPALMCAAAVTTELRVGALVWDNDFKHPVVLGKELATMDLLSDGRVEIGIGAGWEATDYEASGIPFDPPGVRVDRFVESISILKKHFADGAFSQVGEHYEVNNLDGFPKPVQKPHPPLLIGAGGPRMLKIAAREADIVGVNPTLTAGHVNEEVVASMTAEAVDAKVAILREAAGERIADIELNIRAFLVCIKDSVEEAVREVNSYAPLPASQEFLSSTPFALIGPSSKIIDDLLERRERWGFSYVIVGPQDIDDFAPVVAALHGK